MSRDLDLTLLRSFVAVADAAGITAASRSLHLTQGAISQRIARLEALTGHPLFTRDRRGASLTRVGERLIGRARQLLALNDDLWSDMQGGAVTGPVRLGVPYDLVGTWMAPVLQSFCAACPQAELSLVCESSPNLQRALASRRLDLAVIEEPADRITGECLAVERLVWVGARGGRAFSKSPLPVSMVAESCAFRPVILEALKAQPRPWRLAVEDGSLEATLATVRADLAVTACLAGTIPTGIERLPADAGFAQLPPFAITLHQAERPASPAIRELCRHIRTAKAEVDQAA